MNDEQRKLLQQVAFGLGAIRGAVDGLAIATTANNRILSTLDEIEPKVSEVLEPQPELNPPEITDGAKAASAQLMRQRLDLQSKRLDKLQERVEDLAKSPEVPTMNEMDKAHERITTVERQNNYLKSQLWKRVNEMDREYDRQIEAIKERLAAQAFISYQYKDDRVPELMDQIDLLESRLDKVIEVGAKREQKHMDNVRKITEGVSECTELVKKGRDNRSLRIAIDNLENRLTTAEEQIAGIKKGDE